MVGTIEPRKGHGQALDAFEELWADGRNVNLVIVGQYGWKSERLAARLNEHPERGKRLFWFRQADDSVRDALYANCSVLLAGSEAEGFGLPLIEAAQQKLPIIARDLPVFREIVGNSVYYFNGRDGHSLAQALLEWFRLSEKGETPRVEGIKWLTWKQSADIYMTMLLDAAAPGWLDDWRPLADSSNVELQQRNEH